MGQLSAGQADCAQELNTLRISGGSKRMAETDKVRKQLVAVVLGIVAVSVVGFGLVSAGGAHAAPASVNTQQAPAASWTLPPWPTGWPTGLPTWWPTPHP